MRLHKQSAGFSVVELLLVLVVVGILGFTGWFVYHAQQNTTNTLNTTNKSGQSSTTAKTKAVTTFAECKQASGSKMLETYPEQCVTKGGKTFTDTDTGSSQQYLDIKEWGIKLPYGGTDTFTYEFPDDNNQSGVQVISTKLAATYNCTDFGAGNIERLKAGDTADAAGDTASLLYASGNATMAKLGDYYYLFAPDQAECGNAPLAAQQAASNTIKAALTNIKADD